MHDAPRRDTGSTIACIAFVIIGIAAFWAANDFSPLGSVFPKTIAALLVFFGVLYLALSWLRPQPPRLPEAGSRARQAAVAVVMVGWAFVLEPVGFLTSSVVAFVLLLVIAHYGRWTPRIALLYALGSALLLGGLYTLFKVALQVPLPEGVFL